jgi:hypothetical protein
MPGFPVFFEGCSCFLAIQYAPFDALATYFTILNFCILRPISVSAM